MVEVDASRRIPSRIVTSLVLLLLASTAPVSGHTPEVAPEPPPAAEPEREAIPISAIAVERATLEARLTDLSARLDPPSNERRIADELGDTADEVKRRIGRLDQLLARGFTRNDLEKLQSTWSNIRHDLTRWQDFLRERLDDLDELNRELAERAGIWEETATAASEQNAPAEVRSEIAAASKSIQVFERRLRSSRDETLALQKRVVELAARVGMQLDRIAAVQQDVLTRLTVRDAPPLWTLELGDADEHRERAAASLEASRKGLSRYVDRNTARLVLHGLAVVALIGLCLRARRLSLDSGPSASPEEAPPALRHPWAAGLVLGLSSGIWIHRDAPPEIFQLIALAMLPLWVVVVRDLLPASLHRTVVGLAALVFVDLVRRTLQDLSGIARILLVVELAALVVGIVWLRLPRHLGAVAGLHGGGWLQLLSLWLRLSLVAAAFSLAAAVFGWVNLGELIGGAVLQATYAGSILLTAARLVEDVTQSFARAGRLDGLRIIRHDPSAFIRIVRHVTRAVAFLTWILLSLDALGVRALALEALAALLATPVGYQNVNVTLGGIFAFGVTLWISWLLSRLVALTLDQEVFTRIRLPRGVPFALTTIARYTIVVLGFVLAVATLGFDVGNLALLISALGVGIGFGMQALVNNFLSGLVLLFERPIKVGDALALEGGLAGEVTRIGIRASTIRTYDGADVIVPNGTLIAGSVTNWTLADRRRRVSLPVGVVYGTDAKVVIELLRGVLEAHEDVLKHPPPYVLFKGFGDSSLDFEMRFWTESGEALTRLRSEVAVATQAALDRAGIEVPFPQRDVHLRSIVPPEPK